MGETPRTVRGRQTWQIGDRLTAGGIGTIQAAWLEGTEERAAYVAKLVPIEPGSDREFLLAEVADARNVVPVIDSTTTGDYHVLIMPRASRSLADLLDSRGKLDVDGAVRIAVDIAAALSDLDGRVVHRDLKPGNVLEVDGSWRLTDFGISRYAEAATSPGTRKFWMSPPYAAPEQWRHEHATSAADVYALGIVLYEMIAGEFPFRGPAYEDFQAQHLYADPPDLQGVRIDLQTLIVECLYKAPQGRPSPQEVLERLERLDKPPPAPLRPLMDGSHRVARAWAAAGRRAALQVNDERRRAELLAAAKISLERLGTALATAIRAGAPNARLIRTGRSWHFVLGDAELSQSDLTLVDPDPWEDEPAPDLDVIAVAWIRLRRPGTAMSHGLWYCDHPAHGRYGWTELAFTGLLALSAERPYALSPGPEAARAFAGSLDHTVAASWPRVDRAVDAYVERWTTSLAAPAAALDSTE